MHRSQTLSSFCILSITQSYLQIVEPISIPIEKRGRKYKSVFEIMSETKARRNNIEKRRRQEIKNIKRGEKLREFFQNDEKQSEIANNMRKKKI